MTTPKPDMPEKCPTCSHSGLKCLNDNCNHILICGPCLAPTPPEIQDSSKCVCTHHKLIHESLPKHQYGPCRRCNCIGFSAPNSSETPNSSSKIIVTESKNFPFSSKSVKRPTKEEYFDSLPPEEQEEILKLRKVAQSVTKCDQLSDKGILNNSEAKLQDDMGICPASKNDLLKIISQFTYEEMQRLPLMYVDENRDYQPLRNIDFQFDQYGNLKIQEN